MKWGLKYDDTTYRCSHANACTCTHTHQNQDIPRESSLVFFHKELQKLIHIHWYKLQGTILTGRNL
jgi:hypothetical protein